MQTSFTRAISWIGGGKPFRWASQAGVPFPLACLSLARARVSHAPYIFHAPATQANGIKAGKKLAFIIVELYNSLYYLWVRIDRNWVRIDRNWVRINRILGTNRPKLGTNQPNIGYESTEYWVRINRILGTNQPKLGTNQPNTGYESTEYWVRIDRILGTNQPTTGYESTEMCVRIDWVRKLCALMISAIHRIVNVKGHRL